VSTQNPRKPYEKTGLDRKAMSKTEYEREWRKLRPERRKIHVFRNREKGAKEKGYNEMGIKGDLALVLARLDQLEELVRGLQVVGFASLPVNPPVNPASSRTSELEVSWQGK